MCQQCVSLRLARIAGIGWIGEGLNGVGGGWLLFHLTMSSALPSGKLKRQILCFVYFALVSGRYLRLLCLCRSCTATSIHPCVPTLEQEVGVWASMRQGPALFFAAVRIVIACAEG